MKRYLVFAGNNYPEGGWFDFVYDTDMLEAAKEVARGQFSGKDWSHIVDTETKKFVEVNE